MTKTKTEWQDSLNIKQAHPSYDEFGEDGNKFIDFLASKDVSSLYYGYAWEHDESHIRHCSYDLTTDRKQGPPEQSATGTHHDANDLLAGSDYANREWTAILYEAFSDSQHCEDNMYRLDVPSRTIKELYPLYVTEPRLVDEAGGEVHWNAY